MIARVSLAVLLLSNSAFAFGDDLAKQNRDRITVLQRMVLEQNERIDGLTSLLEGLSASVAELKMQLKEQKETSEVKVLNEHIRTLEKRIDMLERSDVQKSSLKNTSQSEAGQAEKVRVEEMQRGSTLETKSGAKLYSEGVRLFVKKRYDEAKKRFILTDAKGYKPAASNYYLGEIAYYTKHYNDAIFYYKKSAGLYDKASYMNVLLLHTAISLDHTGKKKQAKLFYENVIANYPGTKAAEIAKQRMKRL